MKVGLVVPGFSADEDDWCIPALLDYVRLLAARAEVHVFALRYPFRQGCYAVHGATVHAFGAAEGQGAQTARLWVAALKELGAEHRRRRFDVLHAFWADEPGLLVALAARRYGITSVVSLAGGELARLPEIGYGGQLRMVERLKTALALRWADKVTAGSRFLVALARSHLPESDLAKLHWAPLGVDLDLFKPQPASRGGEPGELRLINVASYSPVKDHALLFEALRQVRATGQPARLTLLGDGRLAGRLRTLAIDLAVADAVEFRGHVPREELPGLLQAADLFLQGSFYEAQGLAVLEAGACRVALAGTIVGVLPELAPEAAAGSPPGDPAALAQNILQLVEPAARVELSRAARARIEAAYGLESCVARFLEFYPA